MKEENSLYYDLCMYGLCKQQTCKLLIVVKDMKRKIRKFKRKKRGENDDLMWEKFNLSTK
ncbi:hypothetical protein TTHERM_00584720 (macronuclear) [Tetrahymena thermophila SB210]|uniref:Uncharacterized protein n=1 Tax=Tetrahymena thermophila (strain SB210) TaxID=312017 RepID=I7M6B7_TETTS|nr:hypothetical protein TTHERM_00584720 [Tetrahymena thermophila SB210]EAR84916.1 hypothetical protein TTHERM_00584720 [Tetrahymena thermophila SB210]|eukprot:XP_001032579.1 hypothetical protein TTHERM_00584720 [Tetrahymena thermophila SB210]